ncbi:MAG: Crp/Fnr family transcriptional regulator [Opitutaceae bacterium]
MDPILELCEQANLPTRTIPEGETIISEGPGTGELFILKNGRVCVTKENIELASLKTPGALFGEISVLIGGDSRATVTTMETSTFYVIEDGRRHLKDYPSINHHIAVLLANRLNNVIGYLVDLKQQFAENDDHLGLVDEVLESIAQHQKPSAKKNESSRTRAH